MTQMTEFKARIQARRQALLDLCATRPHNTTEMLGVRGMTRDTLKNDLSFLEETAQLIKAGRVKTLRRGGSEATVWALPGVEYEPRPALASPPEYAFKTRWVTVNPYNPELTPV